MVRVAGVNSSAVIAALALDDAMPANWASGLGLACPSEFSRTGDRFVFISPRSMVGFWLWVPSCPIPPAKRITTSERKAKLGLPDLSGLPPEYAGEKIFSTAEDKDAEEEALVAGGLSHEDAREKVRANGRHAFPDETDVIELAALWSIDPTQLSDQDRSAPVWDRRRACRAT